MCQSRSTGVRCPGRGGTGRQSKNWSGRARRPGRRAGWTGFGGELPDGVSEAVRGELAATLRRDADSLIAVITTG